MDEPVLQDMDDYNMATRYLMHKVLLSGDGLGLRALKTMMDRVSELYSALATTQAGEQS